MKVVLSAAATFAPLKSAVSKVLENLDQKRVPLCRESKQHSPSLLRIALKLRNSDGKGRTGCGTFTLTFIRLIEIATVRGRDT